MKIKKDNGLVSIISFLLGNEETQIFYINGPSVLPPPLPAQEEEELLGRVATDPTAKKTLVERNLRLVVYIAKRFENTSVGLEDLISIGTIGLMKAVSTFKPGKQIKLATYASRCIENEILMFIRKSTGQKAEVSLDEPLKVDYDGNELLISDLLGTDGDFVYRKLEEDEDKRLVHMAVSRLSKRDKQIVSLRFGLRDDGKSGKEYTQKEVADMLGISQSYISRLEKKIIIKLKEYLKKQNY